MLHPLIAQQKLLTGCLDATLYRLPCHELPSKRGVTQRLITGNINGCMTSEAPFGMSRASRTTAIPGSFVLERQAPIFGYWVRWSRDNNVIVFCPYPLPNESEVPPFKGCLAATPPNMLAKVMGRNDPINDLLPEVFRKLSKLGCWRLLVVNTDFEISLTIDSSF